MLYMLNLPEDPLVLLMAEILQGCIKNPVNSWINCLLTGERQISEPSTVLQLPIHQPTTVLRQISQPSTEVLLMVQKSGTSCYGRYPIIYRVLYIPGGCSGFLDHPKKYHSNPPQGLHQLARQTSHKAYLEHLGSTRTGEKMRP